MKRYLFPGDEQVAEIISRPQLPTADIESRVMPILAAVRDRGDSALREFTERFDGAALDSLVVSSEEIKRASTLVPEELKRAIAVSRKNLETFHLSQKEAPVRIETMPGVVCWRQSLPISRIGLYIPGGTAALFSTALMMGVPALIAGCQDIVACTPPGRDGQVNAAVLYTLSELGITRIFKLGGAQAVAALAFGSESVPRVEKIFGPGNQYVTVAKQLVSQHGVAIDIPAGPSEVAVVADRSADPRFIAADLLSQAEHGADSQVLLVTTDTALADLVEQELSRQLETLPRAETARKTLTESRLVIVPDLARAFEIVNCYASEHLIIMTEDPLRDSARVINAGSVFLGDYSPESVGDYASGTNHILPTAGHAARLSGVSLDSFVRKVTFQQLTREGLQQIATTVETMAKAEGLDAHAQAVSIRREGKRVQA